MVVFQVIKSHIDVEFSMDNLKDPSTPLNSSSSSVINGITTSFSLLNIELNYSSFRTSTQFQSSKSFPDNSIDFEDTNLMSTLTKSN